LAGEAGLAVGQITDSGNAAAATWTLLPGTTAQLGGRNPLPYRCATLDWDENIWLGTESAGLLRISKDRSIWTWFDQLEGCPLPDQGVFGIYSDDVNRTLYVGTARGGIAVIQIDENSARASTLLAPFPNPWNPTAQGALTFDQIPITETTTMRMYTIAGDLVAELADVRGPKTWDGRTAAGQFVESGVYLISATSTAGTGSGATVRYEGKVAVVR
jgi:hypothetical protein